MKVNCKVAFVGAIVFVCVVVFWLSTSIGASEQTYEIRPQISLPEYRTDAARAIDAYEILMERYMTITEKRLINVDTNIKAMMKKLDSIETKLTGLNRRIAGIERAVGIEKTHQPKQKAQREKANQKRIQDNPPAMEATD